MPAYTQLLFASQSIILSITYFILYCSDHQGSFPSFYEVCLSLVKVVLSGNLAFIFQFFEESFSYFRLL